MAEIIQEGAAIDFINETQAEIANGEVVPYGSRIAIALSTIPADGEGALGLEGVIIETAEDDTAFAIGDAIYWDNSAKELTKTITAYYAGMAIEAKAQTDTTATVLMTAGIVPSGLLAAVTALANSVKGLTAGIKIKDGITSITGVTGGTIATGLATVTSVTAGLGADAAATGTMVTAKPSATPGSIEISVWKPTAADNSAPILSTTAVSVNWQAFGT
jgi:predicted RecA/RadA family phage recombinase